MNKISSMNFISKIDNQLYRIIIPFETLTTSVYLYICDKGVAIIDSAKYPLDVDEYIIPALEQLKICRENVKYLLLSHEHADHAGGIYRLAELFPDAVVGAFFETDLPNSIKLLDNTKIIGNLQGLHLPGHSDTSFSFYDTDTKTLLSADCLQLDGIGKYRNGISNFEQYINSINRLKEMEINRIVAAHEYDPLGSIAEGKKNVENYLNMCISIAKSKLDR